MKKQSCVEQQIPLAPKRRQRVQISFASSPSLTKQAMKDECDINNIMARYTRTGTISHVARSQGEFGFASAIDFHQAMNQVVRAQELFESLPAALRARFGGDPGAYLDFVSDPENRSEAAHLGLLREPPVLVSPPNEGTEPNAGTETALEAS